MTPGTRDANNGNWRTAVRWARMLRDRYRVIVQTAWSGTHADALVALHARRSAASIGAFHETLHRPIAVVLTGTDLYRDLAKGGKTLESIEIADRLVVLQDDAPGLLNPAWRNKCEVIFQSARFLRHRRRPKGFLDCAVVGHLREEKDPLTLLGAIASLPPKLPVRIRHVGAALDASLGKAARSLARRDARYRYLGALPHGLTRSLIASSDLLIHPSIVEGGANVIVEAITSGTPVIASRISGNLGMLGSDYPGYFEVRHSEALAALLVRASEEPGYVGRLKAACTRRKPLFHPGAEARAVKKLVERLLV